MGIIQLSEVTVRRGRSTVLEKWSLSVDSGEVVCLFGENGCGKSTVIETAAGLVPMENGKSTYQGNYSEIQMEEEGELNSDYVFRTTALWETKLLVKDY